MSSISYETSAALLARAKNVLAGGVSSEFRKSGYPHAMFYSSGEGTRINDVDGNTYLDFTLSQGPLILGHSNPYVMNAVQEYSAKGQLFAGQHIREIELAEKIHTLIAGAEQMRFCLDGSEAVQTALRIARSTTGRTKFLRFEGHYHGWLDNVSWGISAPDVAALGSRDHPDCFPWSEGLPGNSRDQFLIIPWNDAALLEKTIKENASALAAVITEPVMCNNGCIMPAPGYLALMRSLCATYGIALIFDEVITGFRLGLSGAQGLFGITPDLSIFAKAMASGYPISAVTGKRHWFKVVEAGKVIQAGTMNAGNPSVAAALATIEELERQHPYPLMFKLGNALMHGLRTAAAEAGHPVCIQGPGPMFHLSFTTQTGIRDFRDVLGTDRTKLAAFVAAMHDNKVRIISRGLWYISAAHTQSDIDEALDVARRVLKFI